MEETTEKYRIAVSLFSLLMLVNILQVFQNERVMQTLDKGVFTTSDVLIWFLMAFGFLLLLLYASGSVVLAGIKEWWKEE